MFTDLPDHARLWIFTTDQPLSSERSATLLDRLDDHIRQWSSHGRPVPGAATMLHDRFLVVAAHLEGGVSGCGIDSLVHAVESLGQDMRIDWLDGLHVSYRDDAGNVRVVPRPVFRTLVRDGTVTGGTPVFITTIDTLGALRADGIERAASASWHARVFRIPAMA